MYKEELSVLLSYRALNMERMDVITYSSILHNISADLTGINQSGPSNRVRQLDVASLVTFTYS